MLFFFSRRRKGQNLILSQKTYQDFYQFLLEKKLLSLQQIQYLQQEVLRSQKTPELLILQHNLLSEEKLATVFSQLFEIPVTRLPEVFDSEVHQCVPLSLVVRLKIIPFEIKKGIVKIGIVNPFLVIAHKLELQQLLQQQNLKEDFYLVTFSEFQRGLTYYQNLIREEEKEKKKTREFPKIFLKPEHIPFGIINKLPREIAEKYQILVFDYLPEKSFKVAAVHPETLKTQNVIAAIEKHSGIKAEIYQIEPDNFQEALLAYEKREGVIEVKEEKEKPIRIQEEFIESREREEEDIGKILGKDIKNKAELSELVREGQVPKIVAGIINFAVSQRATDIHIQPAAKKVMVRFRIDGLLNDIIEIPKHLLPAIISRIKILSKLKIDEQRVPQDGRFKVNFNSKEVDIRVSTMPTANGEKAVLRLLDKSSGILTLEQLGLQGPGFQVLINEIEKPYGVILSTGPTGSGKTTTLYAILNRIKNPTVNIVTLEDPVEYEIEGVNQSQIHPEIGFTFSTGLRSILRQDPNVIMVGEIRDAETASLVTHAALTGHLVLSTLHTNDAASALPRLINMGVEPFLITSAMNAIVAQRLLRRVCPKCQEAATLPNAILEEIEKEISDVPSKVLEELKIQKPYTLRKGKGCENCNNGYWGRIGIFEVLVMDSIIEELAVKRRPANEIYQAARKAGMLSMKQDGILKVLQGLTTYDEVLRVIAVD